MYLLFKCRQVNQKNLCLNNQWAGTLILVGDVNVSIAVKKKMDIETFNQIQTTTASQQYLLAVQTHNYDVVRRIHCSNGSFICKSRTILQQKVTAIFLCQVGIYAFSSSLPFLTKSIISSKSMRPRCCTSCRM